MESHARSIAKSITYRIGGLVATTTVAWAVTGRFGLAASIGVADACVKVLIYYFHERLWLKVGFGRHRPPDYQI